MVKNLHQKALFCNKTLIKSVFLSLCICLYKKSSTFAAENKNSPVMKRNFLLLLIINCGLLAQAAVNDTFNHNGIRYQITKEDFSSQAFEVSAVYFDSAYIFLPDSVTEGEYAYAVTNTIQWYNPQNCALRHYSKIDMSRAEHITTLHSQRSGLIAIDTLIASVHDAVYEIHIALNLFECLM